MSNTENKKTGKQTESEYRTKLVAYNDLYLGMIERQMEGHNITLSDYSKTCVINALSAINDLLTTNGLAFNDDALDTGTLTTALITVASLQLNAKATNREVYFQLRNKKVKTAEGEKWIKQLEFGIEGDGWDSLVSRFGRNVKKVYPHWCVRADDKYIPAKHRGIEVTPPEWESVGTGEVVRVVYPIAYTDGTVEYLTCERDDVLKNLYAHINNNIMNETFGICQDRFKATKEQAKAIVAKKKEILDRAKALGWAALDDEEISQYISPSWTEYHSRESMIIRKMRNRICRAIPKDFGSSFASDVYSRATDEDYAEAVDTTHRLNDGVIYVDTETGEVANATPDF